MAFDSHYRGHGPAQIFSFAGMIATEGSAGAACGGLARAASHEQVIEQMAEWGFHVTAVSAHSEVVLALEVLEQIAAGSPEVDRSEIIDLMPGQVGPYAAGQVFALTGRSPRSERVYAGFAIAPSSDRLAHELAAANFHVLSTSSLDEVRQLAADMAAAEQDEEILDLMAEAA